MIGNLIRRLNDALGATSIVVTHDVQESLKIVDYVYFLSGGRDRRAGHARGDARIRPTRSCASSCTARPTGRCRSTIRAAPIAQDLGIVPLHARTRLPRGLRLVGIGRTHQRGLAHGLGDAASSALVAAALGHGFPALPPDHRRALFRRRALAHHHHRVRACSSAWCWACRATRRCRRYGSAEARRQCWSRCRWCASSGRWWRRCCSRAAPGSAMTAEIGLMKATEQLVGDGNDGGRSDSRA